MGELEHPERPIAERAGTLQDALTLGDADELDVEHESRVGRDHAARSLRPVRLLGWDHVKGTSAGRGAVGVTLLLSPQPTIETTTVRKNARELMMKTPMFAWSKSSFV